MTKWQHINTIQDNHIWVDYKLKRTKITTKYKTYIHKGIYPFHTPTPYRTYKTKNGRY